MKSVHSTYTVHASKNETSCLFQSILIIVGLELKKHFRTHFVLHSNLMHRKFHGISLDSYPLFLFATKQLACLQIYFICVGDKQI